MGGNPWGNICHHVKWNLDAEYKLLWGFGAGFILVGAVLKIDSLYLLGLKIFALGTFVYVYYLEKYNHEVSKFMISMKRKLSPAPTRPTKKKHSGKKARDKSGRPQFSEQYRK